MTYVPHYDSNIGNYMKNCLDRVKVHHLIEPKVNAFKLDAKSKLIKFLVKRNHESVILNAYQFSNLAEKMSGYQRRQQWRLLYRMSDNGVSMITFMEKIKREETTLILCVDEYGYKFGTL